MIYQPPYREWFRRRTTPGCNVDPATGKAAAAIDPQIGTNPNSPTASFLAWVIQNNLTGMEDAPTTMVQAYTSLCVAQKLNAALEDNAVFSSTSDEHMYLLGTAHEQATVASHLLSRIVQVMLLPGAIPSADSGSGALLRNWMEYTNNGQWKTTIVQDYVRSLRLMTTLTTDFGSFLERQAGSRWTTSATSDPYNKELGS